MLEEQGWKDMNGAPRDGRKVELRLPTGDVELGFWRDDKGWHMEDMYILLDTDFTGWREEI